jgi:hypothetical protein
MNENNNEEQMNNNNHEYMENEEIQNWNWKKVVDII